MLRLWTLWIFRFFCVQIAAIKFMWKQLALKGKFSSVDWEGRKHGLPPGTLSSQAWSGDAVCGWAEERLLLRGMEPRYTGYVRDGECLQGYPGRSIAVSGVWCPSLTKRWLSPLRWISDGLSQTFPCGPEEGKAVLESLEKVHTSCDRERDGDCWSCSSKSDSAKK